MIERFQGDNGRLRRVDALLSQHCIANNQALAERVADCCEVVAFAADANLIEQDATDNHVLFILSGICEVLVHDRLVAERGPGQQVGEMAAIEPSAPRSATVRARDQVVVAQLTDTQISALGDEFPQLYRQFAKDLAHRLRQRGDHVKPSNGVARVFMGSSVEGLPVIRTLQQSLEYDSIDVVIWTDNVVKPGQHVSDALLEQVRCSDFAVFHASADDVTWSRKALFDSPRDNVIFELGMFMGVLGRERAFLLLPRGREVKVPSDLLGITALTYEAPADAKLLQAKLGPAAQAIREAAKRLGPA